MATPKVALVHDWMVSPGGAERMLYSIHQLWPDAPIYTAAYEPNKFPEWKDADIRPLWLNRIKLAKTKHQLFTIPRAVAFKMLNLSNYDIVISSCSAESKYVRTGSHTLHLCYCHTPVRYYWSDYDWYRKHPPFGKLNWLAGLLLPLLIGPLRRIDYRAAQHVNAYIANSHNVAERIRRYYKRDSVVIYPPILTERFNRPRKPGDFYLVAGRQVAYKRLDLVIDAFNKLGWPLVVAGTGEEVGRLRPRSQANIRYVGHVNDDQLADLFAMAKGFVFPPEEDFGMTPVEAMASGCPVIAFKKGGALETVVEGSTGTFFQEQTVASLIAALRHFETLSFETDVIRARAREFDDAVFKDALSRFVSDQWGQFANKRS